MRQRAPSHVLRPPTRPKTLICSRGTSIDDRNHYRMIQSIPCLACCHVTFPNPATLPSGMVHVQILSSQLVPSHRGRRPREQRGERHHATQSVLVTGAGPNAGRRDDTHLQQVVVVWTVVGVVRAVRDRMGSSGCTSRTGSNPTSPHDQSVENTTRWSRESSKARPKRPANTRGYNVRMCGLASRPGLSTEIAGL